MLKALFGSQSSERILIFIYAREKGYPSEIAEFYKANLFSIQQKMDKLEAGGVLVSFNAGRTRVYSFNPRYPFLNELKTLLLKALDFYPEEIKELLIMNRRRPRRRGKIL